MTPHVLDDLEARGLIQDHTDLDALRQQLSSPTVLYCGFDPTADSLHLGNLFPLLLLRRFQDFGHRPIVLAGGATGMIGDPGGRSDERNLLDVETLRANTEAIKAQLARFLDFDAGERSATLVDNQDWTADVTLLEFLRDVGKHVTVNYMLAKESVRNRVESESGISYTEFSYMLLQAHDYWYLHTHHGCVLQVGGSDQWGNITAGIDLVRRKEGATVHGLTVPLMTKADGSKFGKSQSGSVWLDPAKTSPYQLYQYLVQSDDADAERFLLQLTLLPVERCRELAEEHGQAPERRLAQRELARAVTTLVHGEEAARAAEQASAVLFGGPVADLEPAAFEVLAAEVPTTVVPAGDLAEGLDLVEALVRSGLATSKGDARRTIGQGGIYLDGEAVADAERRLTAADAGEAGFVLLRRGKANYALLRVGP